MKERLMPSEFIQLEELPIQPISIDNIKLTKPSPELLKSIREAKIETLYGLLDEDTWKQFLTSAIASEFNVPIK